MAACAGAAGACGTTWTMPCCRVRLFGSLTSGRLWEWTPAGRGWRGTGPAPGRFGRPAMSGGGRGATAHKVIERLQVRGRAVTQPALHGAVTASHSTVGVPVAGLFVFLSRVRDGGWLGGPAGVHLADGLMFGTEVARWFAGSSLAALEDRDVPGFAVDMLSGVEDVAAVRGYLALAYTQVAALLQRGVAGPGPVTDYLAVAPLTPLATIRAALAGSVQGCLAHEAARSGPFVLAYFGGRP